MGSETHAIVNTYSRLGELGVRFDRRRVELAAASAKGRARLAAALTRVCRSKRFSGLLTAAVRRTAPTPSGGRAARTRRLRAATAPSGRPGATDRGRSV